MRGDYMKQKEIEELEKEIKKIELDISNRYSDIDKYHNKINDIKAKISKDNPKIFERVRIPDADFFTYVSYLWYNPTNKILLTISENKKLGFSKWIIRLSHKNEFSYKKVRNLKKAIEICYKMKEKYILQP